VRLSTKSEYACLAILELSEQYHSGYIKIPSIAEKKHIPRKYLEQILLALKRSGYVKSKMGNEGGYSLAKPPSEIFLAEIIRLMDGALAPVHSVSRYFYEPTPIESAPKLLAVCAEIRDYVSNKLENTSFADLM